jgi:hypothetical protein
MVSPKSKSNLRRGNPGNGGRPKSAVRDRFLQICDDSAGFLADVAAGRKVLDGEDKGRRKPTYDERLKAINMAMRYGLGTNATEEAIEDTWDMQPIYKCYGFDPECIGMGTEPDAKLWRDRGKNYFRIMCEDGGELTYLIPPGANPIMLSKEEGRRAVGLDAE